MAHCEQAFARVGRVFYFGRRPANLKSLLHPYKQNFDMGQTCLPYIIMKGATPHTVIMALFVSLSIPVH